MAVQVAPPGSGVTGVVMNVTGLQATTTTYRHGLPGRQAPPDASNLNLVAGQIRPNLVMVGVAPDGTVKLTNASGSVQLIVDVVATFVGTSSLDDDHRRPGARSRQPATLRGHPPERRGARRPGRRHA